MTAISSNPERDPQREIDRRRGRFVPWVIAAFYMTFMSALIGFVVIAYQNPPSEVTPNAYEKGLAYNQTLDKASREAALGWKSQIAYAQDVVRFELRDSQGKAVDGANVRAWFVHPANGADDRNVDLRARGDGVYEAQASHLRAGLWTVHVTAEKNGRQYQAVTDTEVH